MSKYDKHYKPMDERKPDTSDAMHEEALAALAVMKLREREAKQKRKAVTEEILNGVRTRYVIE